MPLGSQGSQTTRYGPVNPVSISESIRQQFCNLDELMRQQFGVPTIREFQIDGVLYQAMGCDAVVNARTGLGKTLVAAGLYALPEFKEKLTILISPLIALQSDMANTFNNKYPIPVPAVVVNSTMDGKELSKVIKAILSKTYRILLISPESLLSLRIRDELLLHPTFKKLVASIVVDEAHCVSVWGSGFRKKYGTLHVVRDYLPNVPVLAMSATLTPRVLRDLENKLHMGKSYGFINVGNERPELAIAIRRCLFPMNSFRDLAFILNKPGGIYHPLDIPKTFIFLDNKTEAYHAINVLLSYLPAHLRHIGIIRPFNARHGTQYRTDAMEHFKEGNIRVLVCTDAAGMGCDIPDVEIVIQWRVVYLSNLIQRWGRGARGPGRLALVVLFVEPSAFTYNPTIPGPKESETPKSKSGNTKVKKSLKEPLRKGGFQSDVIGAQPELRDDSPYEGALVMVQTKGCHRAVWTKVFHNEPVPTCNPELLDNLKPPSPPQAPSTPTTKVKKPPRRGEPHLSTQKALVTWRSRIWRDYHSGASWGASALLSDDLVNYLASIGPIPDYDTLKAWFAHRWGWWDDYGHDLATLITQLHIPHTPLPSKTTTSQKRKAPALDDPPSSSKSRASASSSKRTRAVATSQGPEPASATASSSSTATQKRTSTRARAPKLAAHETLSWSIPGYKNH